TNKPHRRPDGRKSGTSFGIWRLGRRCRDWLACRRMSLEPYLACLHELADASREVILPYFAGANLGVELKSDASPVTLADRGAEEAMRAIIERRFPDHGIIGEEYGNLREDAEFVWVLDPIDGTRSFISAVPLF